MPKSGVYLFSENGAPLYVGRSNRLGLRRRISAHCRPAANHKGAAFAFKIARRETGNENASYRADAKSRKGLMQDPTFRAAFERARDRIQKMDVRFVEVTDPTVQALFEMYVAISLATPYNDFNTY